MKHGKYFVGSWLDLFDTIKNQYCIYHYLTGMHVWQGFSWLDLLWRNLEDDSLLLDENNI